jgi:chromosome segregation ATPase
LLPLVLVSACNGSEKSNQVSQSTYDELKAELAKSEAAKAALAKEKEALATKNAELAGDLNTANATIAGLTSDRDAKLAAITGLNNLIDAEEAKNRKLQAEYDALKLQHEAALKTGKIGQDGKTAFEKELQDKEAALKGSDEQLTKLQGERDRAIADRDRLNEALKKLVDRACR